jgi:hypothetical protein
MATSDPEIARRLRNRMAARLRAATYNNDEVQQAAGTQIVFDASDELMRSTRRAGK